MVFNGLGNKVKTAGGFTKADLMKTKTGKIITKRQHARGKKAYKNIKGWTVAVQKAKKELNLKGFVAVRRGTPLYETAKASTIGASASSSITSMAKSSTIARGKRQRKLLLHVPHCGHGRRSRRSPPGRCATRHEYRGARLVALSPAGVAGVVAGTWSIYGLFFESTRWRIVYRCVTHLFEFRGHSYHPAHPLAGHNYFFYFARVDACYTRYQSTSAREAGGRPPFASSNSHISGEKFPQNQVLLCGRAVTP